MAYWLVLHVPSSSWAEKRCFLLLLLLLFIIIIITIIIFIIVITTVMGAAGWSSHWAHNYAFVAEAAFLRDQKGITAAAVVGVTSNCVTDNWLVHWMSATCYPSSGTTNAYSQSLIPPRMLSSQMLCMWKVWHADLELACTWQQLDSVVAAQIELLQHNC